MCVVGKGEKCGLIDGPFRTVGSCLHSAVKESHLTSIGLACLMQGAGLASGPLTSEFHTGAKVPLRQTVLSRSISSAEGP